MVGFDIDQFCCIEYWTRIEAKKMILYKSWHKAKVRCMRAQSAQNACVHTWKQKPVEATVYHGQYLQKYYNNVLSVKK